MTGLLQLHWDHFLCSPTTGDLSNCTTVQMDFEDQENQDSSNIAIVGKPSLGNKRAVRFPYQPITSILVLEDPLPEDSWYSTEEIQRSARSVKQLIQAARRDGRMQMFGPHFQNPNFRGLEDLVSLRAVEDRRNRLTRVIRGVLEEQRRQTRLSIVHGDRLGQASEVASKQSRDQAMMRGSLDAMAAYPFGVARTFQCLQKI
jgi:hypothetical protein